MSVIVWHPVSLGGDVAPGAGLGSSRDSVA
jgi:hypothetical protein